MITIRFSGRMPSPREIPIGQETDQAAEKLRFRLPEIAPGQIATLQLIYPDGTSPDAIAIEDGVLTVPASLTEQAGRCRAWVEILADNTVAWHSELFYLDVGELPPISEETERAFPTALQEAIYRSENAKKAAESAAAIAQSAQGSIAVEINGDGDLIVTYEDTEGETHAANLGPVSAYSVAVKYGYQGTEEEWEQNVASVGVNAAAAAESAEDAADSAEAAATAKTAAQAAQTAAETAAERDVTAWLDEHAQTAQIAVIDNTLSIEGAAAEAKVTGDELGQLKSALNTAPKILDSDETVPDLDVSDPLGNVLARFQHGEFETRKFRGYQYRRFAAESAQYTGAALTLMLNRSFIVGDRIVLHVERGAMPWELGGEVTYYAGETDIFGTIRGDNAWMEYTLTEDVESISAVYAASATGVTSGQTLTLEVYLLGDLPIRPTIVKLAQDGSGDYTTLRAAIESIGYKADDVIHPYVIEVYPGTYNVMEDYTAEEINAASYTQSGFVGPKLLNGVSLVGVGPAYKNIINGYLDPEVYGDPRGELSPINTQGSLRLENLTVRAGNMRYAVHDDFYAPLAKRTTRIVKNCIFEAYGAMGTNVKMEYGAATSMPGTIFWFENCFFQHAIGIHNRATMYAPCEINLINCKGFVFSATDYETSSSGDIKYRANLYGCSFYKISTSKTSDADQNTSHMSIYSDSCDPVYLAMNPLDTYITGNVYIVGTGSLGFEQGHLLKRYSFPFGTFRLADSVDNAIGIVIHADDLETYVQTGGIVKTDRIGLTGVALGDYIGMDENHKAVIVSTREQAIGRVIYASNGEGYVKLKWRLEDE